MLIILTFNILATFWDLRTGVLGHPWAESQLLESQDSKKATFLESQDITNSNFCGFLGLFRKANFVEYQDFSKR